MPLKINEEDRQVNPANYPGVKSKSQLIDRMFRDRRFLAELKRKMHNRFGKFEDDVLQDLAELLLKKDEQYLLDINEKGQIKYLIYGILWTMTQSLSSSIHRTYIKGELNHIEFNQYSYDNASFDKIRDKEVIDENEQTRKEIFEHFYKKTVKKWERKATKDFRVDMFLDYEKNHKTSFAKPELNYGYKHIAAKFNCCVSFVNQTCVKERKKFYDYLYEKIRKYEKQNKI